MTCATVNFSLSLISAIASKIVRDDRMCTEVKYKLPQFKLQGNISQGKFVFNLLFLSCVRLLKTSRKMDGVVCELRNKFN